MVDCAALCIFCFWFGLLLSRYRYGCENKSLFITTHPVGMAMTGKQAIACEWSFLGLALIFVLLRLYIRFFYTRNATYVDALVVLTWVFFASTVICDSISASKGLFADDLTYNSDLVAAYKSHTENNSLDSLISVLKILYASSFPYISELWGLKVCFLILYGSLIPSTMRVLRIGLYFTWGIVGLGYIVSMLMMSLWCLPVDRNWDIIAAPADRCFSYSSYPPYFTLTAFHIITDICIYVLPFPVLKTLTLNRKQHWGVISIFALGGVCIVSTIARTVAIGLTANIAQVGFWTSLEQMTGLIVVCVPALKALVSEHRSRDVSRVKSDYGDGRGSRMSRLRGLSVSGNKSEGRGNDEIDTRWIRMDSSTEVYLQNVSNGSVKDMAPRRSHLSTDEFDFQFEEPARWSQTNDQVSKSHFDYDGTDSANTFDAHLQELEVTKKVTLKKGVTEFETGGRSRKFSVVERI